MLFLTLRVFSATGGIEKVCRVAGKALYEDSIESNKIMQIFSMYDTNNEAINNKYFPSENFRGFGINKKKFVTTAVAQGCKSRVVILSHINLLTIGFFVKKISPETCVVLFAHGIEIWHKLSGLKKTMLKQMDLILPVSQFTANKISAVQNIDPEKLEVLNNCLDPFLAKLSSTFKSENLLNKYNFKKDDIILLTLTRLSSTESYKGYDKVFVALSELSGNDDHIKYLLVGKYDEKEKKRIDLIIKKLQIANKVSFAGFIKDEELADHFNLADVYVMPSEKEGFGIVFIEAMYYGKPVIAGNIDGSVDALYNGELGTLVNPHEQGEVTAAIKKVIQNKNSLTPNYALVMKKFGYTTYKNNLKSILKRLKN